MCDTMLALGDGTEDGEMIFGKNSDRDPTEAQNIVVFPPMDHKQGDTVKCTYIEIPQVEHTYGVMLSQPEWMWGAEMGINEFGLVIGNEALFTKANMHKKNDRLLGMDMLRLALERCKTSKEALDTLIELLEKHGQGGNCKSKGSMYYHNAFLIGDGKEAYVLETADDMWIWKKIKSHYSIGNVITIESEYDGISDNLIPFTIKKGWCKCEADFNFKKAFSGSLMDKLAKGQERRDYSYNSLCQNVGKVNFKKIANILRSHSKYGNSPDWKWNDASLGWVCVHSKGITTPSESTNSTITIFKAGKHYTFSTFGSFPCSQVFRFAYSSDIKTKVQDLYKPATANPDKNTEWWSSGARAFRISTRFKSYINQFGKERDELEAKFVAEALSPQNPNELVKSQKERADKFLNSAEEKLSSEEMVGISGGIKKYRKKCNPLI